jgi:hypothetical protein
MPVVVLFAAALAMNAHLLIGLFALTRSEALVRGVWRWRVLLDLAVAFYVPTVTLPEW